MRPSRRTRDIFLVVGLLAVPLLVLRANTRAPHELNFVDRAILRISAPLETGVTATARGLGHLWSRYVHLVGVEYKNEVLLRENAKLRLDLEQANRKSARITQLERLLGLRAEMQAETAAARIIGVDTSIFFRVIRVRLDRGDVEVRSGMPVIVPEGVVGRVGRVFGRYCEVTLAVDPKSSIDIIVPRTGGRGVLKGMAGDNDYRARIEYLLRNEDVREGDPVVTSGVGGVFPRGLAVGTVSKVLRRDYGLYQEAEVTSPVDFARLEEVLILLAPPPPTDSDVDKNHVGIKRASDPSHGLGVPR